MNKLKYVSQASLCLVIAFGLWVGSAQLGSYIFRGTNLEDVMILVAVCGDRNMRAFLAKIFFVKKIVV